MDDQSQLGRDLDMGQDGDRPADASGEPTGWTAPTGPPPASTDLGGGGYEPPPAGPVAAGAAGSPRFGLSGGAGRWVAMGAAAVVLLGAVGFSGYELGSAPKSSATVASQAVPSPASLSTAAAGTVGKVDVSKVVAKVDPGVVDITSSNSYTGAVDAGTGMILTSNGEVLTNNHVIAGGTSIVVQVDGSGPKYQAKVVGTDPTQDVALLQLQNVSGLHPVTVGNSASVTVGEPVIAIGNALDLPGSPTVTEGAISALNRSISASNSGNGSSENLVGLFQTDAPLSPGNSGGPLVNSQAQVIGMNTAAATSGAGQASSNVGFSIPINEALSIASQIQQGQSSSKIEIGTPAFLGVDVEDIPTSGSSGGFFGGFGYNPPVSAGALVTAVVPGTPAAQAGLVAGDVITSFGGQSISSVSTLTTLIQSDKPGQSVSLGWVTAADAQQSATITLASGPPA
ncbi:MAG TPA: trypsin-like peptidase domain-containing protein [Candidatus Dormibacteraeota bacterium]|nr:trypsin-like peptidase domain-containing protein [Candidatus Dormibacteraeota bacterium]